MSKALNFALYLLSIGASLAIIILSWCVLWEMPIWDMSERPWGRRYFYDNDDEIQCLMTSLSTGQVEQMTNAAHEHELTRSFFLVSFLPLQSEYLRIYYYSCGHLHCHYDGVHCSNGRRLIFGNTLFSQSQFYPRVCCFLPLLQAIQW